MYLMYIDESGDCGINNSPTKYYILSAIIIHELKWRETLSNLVEFRKRLRDSKGLKLREEIHSTDFINSPGPLVRIKRNDRLDILKKCIDWINNQENLSVFSVAINKTGKSEIFDLAWNTLLNRFENTLYHKNFLGIKNTDDRLSNIR